MSSVRPRRLVHRGTVVARGIAIDVALVGLREARARVLAMSTVGAVVLSTDDLLIVRFADPLLVDADHAIGAPLVSAGERLVAAPLSRDELGSLDGPSDAIVLVRQGIAVPLDPRRLVVEDLAAWIDVIDLALIPVVSLGLPPAPIEDVEPKVANARAVLGVGPGSPERQQVLDAMLVPTTGRRAPTKPSASRLATYLLSGIARVVALLVALRPTVNASAHRAAPSSQARGLARPRARASIFDRVGAWVQNTLARALIFARLADRIGEQHAEHLRRVLEMMDRGDYTEALRHAIPLGGPVDDEAARIALRAKTAPRTSLEIHAEAMRARSIIPFGDALQAHLRQKYRAAFERLAALGRNEEAAFVLAELLHANEEAVSFLEKVGQKRLAAELAEARGLPPGLVVRQWFVAGDLARAIQVARRTDSFADAVLRLAKQSPPDADALTIAWAESLAKKGDFAQAQEIAWPVEAARGLARLWLDLAIETGGPGGAKALVRKLTIEPEALASLRPHLDGALLSSESANALAETLLLTKPPTALTRHVARTAARAFLRLPNHNAQRRSLSASLFTYSGDAVLKADMPALDDEAAGASLRARTDVLVHPIGRDTSSGPAARVAVRLPRGRTLVALGEAGASLLSADGRVLFHVDEPAYDLVVSDGGDRALLLAPRGEMVRVARVDLLRRRSAYWADVRLSRWSPDFDGGEWFVAQDRTVLAIDAFDDARFAASWQVDVEEPVVAIARTPKTLLIQVGALSEKIVWRYELPSMTLRARFWRPLDAKVVASTLVASGWFVANTVEAEEPPSSGLMICPIDVGHHRVMAIAPNAKLHSGEGWLVVIEEGTARLVDLNFTHSRERCRVVVDSAIVSARLAFGALALVDAHGTIVHVDLETGAAATVHARPRR